MIINNNYLTLDNAMSAERVLVVAAKEFECWEVCKKVLFHPGFRFCSGSSKPEQHHYGDYGLIIHTEEVCAKGLTILKYGGGLYAEDKDYQEFIISAIFHDFGKVFDYEKKDGVWGATDHKRKIHHITRSALFFNEKAKECGLSQELTDAVTHNILAHHGQRAWGSPVAPATPVAWALHCADMASARMYDCGSFKRI